jgi:hypothetical protein
MIRTTLQMRDFAERVVAFEAGANKFAGSENPVVFGICEKLRPHWANLIGSTGFSTLLLRALVSARGKVAWLRTVQVQADGVLARSGKLGAQLDADEMAEGSMVLLVELLGLLGAKRLVIDSLVGFEMALASGFRADFRESLYRMISALTGAGITVLSTVEVEDSFDAMPFSHYAISFLTDDIIRLRYVEIDGQLRKVTVVIKMRGGNHSKDIREYVITHKSVVIIHPRCTEYEGLTTGIPRGTGPRLAQKEDAAPEPKAKK